MNMNCKTVFLGFILVAAALFMSCSTEDPHVVCGREWNPAHQVVADTGAEFAMNDQLFVQFRYGKNFDFSELTTKVYRGTLENLGDTIWTRSVKVTEKMGAYTLVGRASRGGYMNARELARVHETGPIVFEFSANGKVLAAKSINLISNKTQK